METTNHTASYLIWPMQNMSTTLLILVVGMAVLGFAQDTPTPDHTETGSSKICYTIKAQGVNPEQVSGYVVYPPLPVMLQLPTNVEKPKPVNSTTPTETSSSSEEPRCKWKRVLKAVSGNGRDIYVDWAQGNSRNDNENVAEAREIQSDQIFRASSIIDTWDQRDIDRVRIEIFKEGVRVAWFLFNGMASDKNSWMSKDRLIASKNDFMKEGGYNHFSTIGDDRAGVKRRFYIARTDLGCDRDCGYLLVTSPLHSHRCPYEDSEKSPAFYYSSNRGCATWSSEAERRSGDRFVISVRDCEITHSTDES